MTQQQRLQTILLNESTMMKLPHDLHPYIYKFVADEVKVHYWMQKYNWTDTLHELGEHYDGLHIVYAYFHHLKDGENDKFSFLHNSNAYREKDKWRDAEGRVNHVEWSWNDDCCNYPTVYDRLGNLICEQYRERRDMNGLYKMLAYFITLWDDIDTLYDHDYHDEPDQI